MSEIENFMAGVSCLPSDVAQINPAELFDAQGVLMPQPAAFWQSKTRQEKMLFGHTHGLYSFVTSELAAELHQMIAGRQAIEIAAGNGGIARALGIPGTDSHQQADPIYSQIYKLAGQPVVNYGPHVEKLEATMAVLKYEPKVVVASWATHLYNPHRHDHGGNVVGIDEHFILSQVDDYIFIGNTAVHEKKPLFHDLNCGVVQSHKISEYYVGTPMLQSRSSRGCDFLLRLTRK